MLTSQEGGRQVQVRGDSRGKSSGSRENDFPGYCTITENEKNLSLTQPLRQREPRQSSRERRRRRPTPQYAESRNTDDSPVKCY